MSDMFLLSQDSKFMTFAFAFKCLNVRTFDFVNVMNSYIDIHNHLFVFCLLFKFKHVGCWLQTFRFTKKNGWLETFLPTLLSNYELKDIYNAVEFGLFYECLPNKTYQLTSEKCSGRS